MLSLYFYSMISFMLHDGSLDSYILISFYVCFVIYSLRRHSGGEAFLRAPVDDRITEDVVMGTFELEFQDEKGYMYTGPVSIYMHFREAPQASFKGVFWIGQRMPFPKMLHPPRTNQHDWDSPQSSHVDRPTGFIPRRRARHSQQYLRIARWRRFLILYRKETLTEPRLRVYRRRYGEGKGSSRYPY